MSRSTANRRPSLNIGLPSKDNAIDCDIGSIFADATGGELTPDPGQSGHPLKSPDKHPLASTIDASSVKKIGKYLVRGLPQSTVTSVATCEAYNCETQEDISVKVFPLSNYNDLLAPYWATGEHENISQIHELILVNNAALAIFENHVEDLHSYIRRKRRIRELEASVLFKQIVSAVQHCHDNGVVVRDVKLRKFVFTDSQRTQLVLEGLEEGHVLNDDDDDLMTDKHGCLAYVSPEILCSAAQGYSGKAADVWSLGVILYTMLVGQYPFHDGNVGHLFKKIRSGNFMLPECLSSQAKCLLRNLLRTDPSERLDIENVLQHPWFRSFRIKNESTSSTPAGVNSVERDQTVPAPPLSSMQEDQMSLLENIFSKSNDKTVVVK